MPSSGQGGRYVLQTEGNPTRRRPKTSGKLKKGQILCSFGANNTVQSLRTRTGNVCAANFKSKIRLVSAWDAHPSRHGGTSKSERK